MRRKNQNSSWYYNRSKRDIVIAELDLTLKSGHAVDLYQIKPTLGSEFVRYSERFGVLSKRMESGDILKLDGPPPAPTKAPDPIYTESKEMLVTRVRSCVEVDPAEKDFIENLEHDYLKDGALMDDHQRSLINDRFAEEVDLDGFADPLADQE